MTCVPKRTDYCRDSMDSSKPLHYEAVAGKNWGGVDDNEPSMRNTRLTSCRERAFIGSTALRLPFSEEKQKGAADGKRSCGSPSSEGLESLI